MRIGIKNQVAMVWGILGVLFLLGQACWRLALEATNAFGQPWNWYHWLVFLLILIFMAYSEGYRAFQLQFSPRVVSRARTLLHRCSTLQLFLAPLFCMGFFHATRKRKIVTWSVTAGIIVLIIGVRALPHPWRGMVDAGVVVGLGWGALAILIFSARAWRDPSWHYPPDLPETTRTED